MKIYLHRLMLLLIAWTMSLAAIADDFTLKGKVVDEEEHALEFVTVMCPSQGKVTMTNLKENSISTCIPPTPWKSDSR